MRSWFRCHRIVAVSSWVILGIGLFFASGAFADAPLGILGDVTVQNGPSNPVPVTIQGTSATEPILLRVWRNDFDFQGGKDIFVDKFHNVCVGAVPVCQSLQLGAYVVPADKYLVIHHVSLRTRVLTGNPVPAESSGYLAVEPPSLDRYEFSVGLMDITDPTLNIWRKSLPMHVTVPANSKVSAIVQWSGFGADNVEASIDISGELVSAP